MAEDAAVKAGSSPLLLRRWRIRGVGHGPLGAPPAGRTAPKGVQSVRILPFWIVDALMVAAFLWSLRIRLGAPAAGGDAPPLAS